MRTESEISIENFHYSQGTFFKEVGQSGVSYIIGYCPVSNGRGAGTMGIGTEALLNSQDLVEEE